MVVVVVVVVVVMAVVMVMMAVMVMSQQLQINIGYAQKPKIMDIKKLKQSIWEEISEPPASTSDDTLGQENDDTVSISKNIISKSCLE